MAFVQFPWETSVETVGFPNFPWRSTERTTQVVFVALDVAYFPATRTLLLSYHVPNAKLQGNHGEMTVKPSIASFMEPMKPHAMCQGVPGLCAHGVCSFHRSLLDIGWHTGLHGKSKGFHGIPRNMMSFGAGL